MKLSTYLTLVFAATTGSSWRSRSRNSLCPINAALIILREHVPIAATARMARAGMITAAENKCVVVLLGFLAEE
ncbi:hypothetical protein NM208_g8484 [Fusarium decemcellulare]|uniref:Uncharacterized protein n=2 Tax=Fusarium decemcellulare TaxID=57161 RepID=A0ACC1S556_9HYPO|nr:hypothetical protein NM208_g8607 [Fusarium decemcellulare]KAJ3532338.1 hypothetical protein NM208_g8484 [Fusarium decemcellulare]